MSGNQQPPAENEGQQYLRQKANRQIEAIMDGLARKEKYLDGDMGAWNESFLHRNVPFNTWITARSHFVTQYIPFAVKRAVKAIFGQVAGNADATTPRYLASQLRKLKKTAGKLADPKETLLLRQFAAQAKGTSHLLKAVSYERLRGRVAVEAYGVNRDRMLRKAARMESMSDLFTALAVPHLQLHPRDMPPWPLNFELAKLGVKVNHELRENWMGDAYREAKEMLAAKNICAPPKPRPCPAYDGGTRIL